MFRQDPQKTLIEKLRKKRIYKSAGSSSYSIVYKKPHCHYKLDDIILSETGFDSYIVCPS